MYYNWISSLKLVLDEFSHKLYLNFIAENRYKMLINGLGITLQVTFFAIILGILIGFVLALAKLSKFKAFNGLASVYIDVIRGTPVVVQLLIMYFIIFGSVDVSKILVAVIAFGINSGAYVAEIVRAGILAVDRGQMEAGRSLGLSYGATMWYIIIPQAVKNILPALVNEFIVLLKETAIVGYIALEDLTKAGDIIRSRTYDPYVPLLSVAIIYFIITTILSKFLARLERRLRQGDRH